MVFSTSPAPSGTRRRGEPRLIVPPLTLRCSFSVQAGGGSVPPLTGDDWLSKKGGGVIVYDPRSIGMTASTERSIVPPTDVAIAMEITLNTVDRLVSSSVCFLISHWNPKGALGLGTVWRKKRWNNKDKTTCVTIILMPGRYLKLVVRHWKRWKIMYSAPKMYVWHLASSFD